ncbi:flagellar basal body rod protein FlgB [Nitrospira sp. Kam-Ns4a]
MKLFDRTILLLERALDLRAARHQVIASNIANEETPGYRAKELPFREALAAAVRGEPAGRLLATHPRHFLLGRGGSGSVGARLTDASAGASGLDANTVNLEVEMAKLTDNVMQYNAAAAVVAMRLQQLLTAIREAR